MCRLLLTILSVFFLVNVGAQSTDYFIVNDILKIQQGYTRKYEIKYNYPYISQTWGVFGEIFYADQKEIGYTTENNKTLFHQEADERVLLSRFRTSIGAALRPDVFHFHDFKLEYHHNAIDDFVAREISPDYFLDGETDLYYFALKYDFVLDKRIFKDQSAQKPSGICQ